MAVAFDAVGPSASGATSATSPLTFTHVCGASATHLLVGVTWDGATDTGASLSATYNSVSMTALTSALHTGGGTAGFLATFYLAAPATGSHSVVVTAAGGSGLAGLNGGSISFTGSTVLGTPQTAVSSGVQANPSLGFTGSQTGNQVVAFAGSGSVLTASGSFTSRFNDTTGSGSAGAGFAAGSSIAGTGGTVTASWTMTADFWAVAAVEVQAGGGPGTPSAPYSFPQMRTERIPGHAGGRIIRA